MLKTNDPWHRLDNNETITPAQKDGSLNTVDFAMLTTLSRMYGIIKYGKTYEAYLIPQ